MIVFFLRMIDIITHSIELKSDAKPLFIKQYKLPESQKDEIQKQINKMEKEEVIEKCPASGWNSPIIIVPKRDENGEKTNYRLVVDFRRLNEATVPIQFPIPQIDSKINQLTHSKRFSILDLHSALYHQALNRVRLPLFRIIIFHTVFCRCQWVCAHLHLPCNRGQIFFLMTY